jgi:hypothetical protein
MTTDTDYLVIGGGAAGMAFADALVAECDARVVMVDRRDRPGGHWNDAYPFVRIHQASANYGVNSRVLGTESIDETGPNAGFYDRASGVEICDYYQKVLDEKLLPSGQVRFFGMCDYVGDWCGEHAIRSRVTGATTSVRVRRKLVDATYLETSVPATHRRSFNVDAGVHCVPVGELVDLAGPPSRFTILGAGKTSMDACIWLLDHGVDPDRIRWVRPREPWMLDRGSWQPLDLVASTMEGIAASLEALGAAESLEDLFRRVEACGQLARLDRTVVPSMFRGPIMSPAERTSLEQIESVVRLGHVRRLCSDRIVLERGEVPTDPGEVYVDCTAYGFRSAPARPIFERGRITIQSLIGGFTTFYAALVAFVEATRDDDGEKNRLCPPVPPINDVLDWIVVYRAVLRTSAMHAAEPDLAAWLERSRLNLTRGIPGRAADPRLRSALVRWQAHAEPALRNAETLLASASQA